MADNSEDKKYEPYDDQYFTMTRGQLNRIIFASLWCGYPYEAPFFGFCLEDGHTHHYANRMKKRWEEKHGPMPPITIIEDGSPIEI